MAAIAEPRIASERTSTRRRSNRSLTAPPTSRSNTCGTIHATPTSASAVGTFEIAYTCQAIATTYSPSPRNDTVIPAPEQRKVADPQRSEDLHAAQLDCGDGHLASRVSQVAAPASQLALRTRARRARASPRARRRRRSGHRSRRARDEPRSRRTPRDAAAPLLSASTISSGSPNPGPDLPFTSQNTSAFPRRTTRSSS